MRPGEVAAKVAAVVAADLARGQEPCVFELDPGGHSHITNGEFDRAKCLWAYGVDRANARVRAAHWPATNETTLFRSQHVSVDEEIPMLVAPLEFVVPSPDAAVWDACYAAYGEGQADHTHYAHIYDHKQRVLYWRHQSNLQLERVKLADVLQSEKSLPMFNTLPFYQDAAHAFA